MCTIGSGGLEKNESSEWSDNTTEQGSCDEKKTESILRSEIPGWVQTMHRALVQKRVVYVHRRENWCILEPFAPR